MMLNLFKVFAPGCWLGVESHDGNTFYYTSIRLSFPRKFLIDSWKYNALALHYTATHTSEVNYPVFQLLQGKIYMV